MIDQVRSFNRLVTQSVGALHDRYLSRDLPLGEARLLWEIGDGCDVRSLRSRLDLDSGYVSRLLRSLEAAGYVTVRPSPHDRRVRSVAPTAAGRRERAVLDRASDELARSLLEPLRESQRERLVAAMAEVERLLSAGLVRFEVVDPESAQARFCIGEYYAELARRFEDGWDDAISVAATPEQLRPPEGLFAVATLHGEPVGCGALKLHGRRPAELKRMWVAPSARGLGLGRRILSELERLAAEHGVRTVRLETNRALVEAIALYRSAGYHEVAAFNDEPYAHHWFEKRLRPGDR
ncbi:MAG TPA: helix-turn-helix domain-containing GNAT family N-acetyltransferase [Gaiellaceae bacterium]|jgi:DNA-binding MarR family transcriptional regulator/GNAT superfamily N-acetyltransferase|nr:helix-turn-helix domain-containing GNAT family N-acetyltransferase [Gaiellaceae bacterium]